MKISRALKKCSLLASLMVFSGILSSCAYQRATLDQSLAKEIEASDAGKIPLIDFFGDPEFSNMEVSPGGQYLASIFYQNGKKMLGITSTDLKKMYHVVKFDGTDDVLDFGWANDERLYVYAGTTYGNLDGRRPKAKLYFVNYDGTKLKDFFKTGEAGYQILSLTPKDPDTIVMSKYHGQDRGKPVAVRFDIYNGHVSTISTPPSDVTAMVADDDGNVNLAIATDYSEDYEAPATLYVKQGKDWTKIEYPEKGKGPLSPQSYDAATNEIYVLSSRETGRAGLYALNVKTGKKRLVFAHETVDIARLIQDGDKIVGVIAEGDRPEIIILDSSSPKMQLYKKLQGMFPDELVSGLNLTQAKNYGIFTVSSDRNPGEYFSVDIASMKVQIVAKKHSKLDPAKLGYREPFKFQARDKMEIHGYVTLPLNAEMNSKLPTIVIVHGGPFGPKDSWFYNPESQFFASRGYAVVQVNFRGSGGYGYKFQEAGHKQWGRAMQDDVTDATKWAIQTGLSDPNRICIYGGSYGGYAALQGVVKEPDLYKCAISYVGVSNLTIKHDNGDASRSKAGIKFMNDTVGTDAKELAEYSPALHADRIKVPVFLIHGEDDIRVPIIHAESMREGLVKNNKPFQWLTKPSEGHGFIQVPNRVEAYHGMLKFFDANIGVTAAAAGAPAAPTAAPAAAKAP